MVVSSGASTCLPDARAKVQIISDGQAEDMFIVAKGLPPNTAFDFFVIQVPNTPFGLSWYQGDIPIRLKQVARLLREGGGHGRRRPAWHQL